MSTLVCVCVCAQPRNCDTGVCVIHNAWEKRLPPGWGRGCCSLVLNNEGAPGSLSRCCSLRPPLRPSCLAKQRCCYGPEGDETAGLDGSGAFPASALRYREGHISSGSGFEEEPSPASDRKALDTLPCPVGAGEAMPAGEGTGHLELGGSC